MKARAFLFPLMLMPVVASAQFDFGPGVAGGASGSWSDIKFNTKTTLKLDFHNASPDAIIDLFERASGVTIVKDPTLTGTLTLTSARPVSLKVAFQILAATLSLKGFDLQKDGNLLVIKAKPAPGGRGGGGGGGGNPGQTFPTGPAQEPAELRVYPIEYANASQVARVLNDVFSGAGAQQQPQFFGGRGGRGGGNPMQRFFQNMAGNQGASNVKASADDYSNAVIVNAPARDQIQVASLIKSLDKQTDEPQHSQVFHLLYANATDLASVVSNVLVQNAPRGKGGLTATNIPPQQLFQQAMRFGGTQAAFGQVAADTHTNSLIVTSTPANLALVGKVITELDVPATVVNTTFVFPLSNARATDVATLFQQAFGNRPGSGATGARPATGGSVNTNPNAARPGTTGGAGGRPATLGGQVVPTDPNSVELALEDPNGNGGALQTNIDVAQFGGFGGQFRPGGQQGGASAQAQPYRNDNGQIVNVRDLTGQVTVIPDPNTNSLIVVAPPDYATVLRNVLDQLDKTPQQVMIETVVVEASLDAESKLGVEFNYTNGRWLLGQNNALGGPAPGGKLPGAPVINPTTGVAGPPTSLAPGFSYALSSHGYTAFLNALQTDQRFKVLSTPRIFTSNNQQASINISQSIPYVLSTITDVNGNQSFNYAFENVGIILTVTPQINANGFVNMVVSQTADELQGYTTFNAPIVNQRQANTTVSVKDGSTVILGGIIQDQVTTTVKKLPILGDLPILGNLFRSTSKGDVKTELLIFMTPRIVRTADDATNMTNDTQKELAPDLRKSLDLIKPKITTTGGTPPVKIPGKTSGGGK